MIKRLPEKYPAVKEISDAGRIGIVREIFSTITGRYDFLNRLLSLRRDVAWRRFAAKKMRFIQTGRYLDVACGTGDLSLAAAHRYPQITVTGIDFVEEMVEAARKKAQVKKLASRVSFLQGDALRLPFNDNSFDVAGIAFGIRNIPDRERALAEMRRVVVPGGQVMVLEMSFSQRRLFRPIYSVYLNRLLPLQAKLFSQNPAAYFYLADSIMNFPPPDEFAKIMAGVDLARVQKFPLTFGITWLYVGIKGKAGRS